MDRTTPTSTRHTPAEDAFPVGIDRAPDRRPGVPRERTPGPDTPEVTPTRQRVRGRPTHRKGLDRVTPVYGTVQPPRGLSGIARRIAYRVPEHRARHWMLLLAADRVDTLEDRLGRALARPLRDGPLDRVGRRIERNPIRALAVAAATGFAARYLLRSWVDTVSMRPRDRSRGDPDQG